MPPPARVRPHPRGPLSQAHTHPLAGRASAALKPGCPGRGSGDLCSARRRRLLLLRPLQCERRRRRLPCYGRVAPPRRRGLCVRAEPGLAALGLLAAAASRCARMPAPLPGAGSRPRGGGSARATPGPSARAARAASKQKGARRGGGGAVGEGSPSRAVEREARGRDAPPARGASPAGVEGCGHTARPGPEVLVAVLGTGPSRGCFAVFSNDT